MQLRLVVSGSNWQHSKTFNFVEKVSKTASVFGEKPGLTCGFWSISSLV